MRRNPKIVSFGSAGAFQAAAGLSPNRPSRATTVEIWRAIGEPEVDLDELAMGIETEQEHGVAEVEAGRIALDHLREFPDYYTRLTKMEDRAKAGLPPNPRVPLPETRDEAFERLRRENQRAVAALKRIDSKIHGTTKDILTALAETTTKVDFMRVASEYQTRMANITPQNAARRERVFMEWEDSIGEKIDLMGRRGLEPNATHVSWKDVVAEVDQIDRRHRGTPRSWQAPYDAHRLSWTRERVRIQDLPETDPWSASDVKRYAKLSPGAPPVVLVHDSNGYHVWDGAHRVAAARVRGDRDVDAFVGREAEVTPNGGSSLPRVRASFDRHFDKAERVFPDLGTIELHEDELAGSDNGAGSERQFGYCADEKPIRIAFAPKTEKIPAAYIDGLMAHEFGHAIDFRYGRAHLEKLWGVRLPDSIERRADKIAEHVFRRPIEYGEHDIQCIGCGGKKSRPRRLG